MISKKQSAYPLAAPQWSIVLVVSLCLAAAGDALAYKVERVCETSEPTGKKPATKTCKTLLVKAEGAGKDDKKEAKKEEKPAPAHH